jgi:YHS domain-containing protein
MSIDHTKAVAAEPQQNPIYYFCSKTCHGRFLKNPGAYGSTSTAAGEAPAGSMSDMLHAVARPTVESVGTAATRGSIAAAALLVFYFGSLTAISGWSFTLDQFRAFWPFIVTLAAGFGVQFGLFTYLRRALHAAHSGKIVAASGTTSGVAMVSCCAHYLVNLLPALGATGLVSLVGAYQIQLFWVGLLANLAGIVYMGIRVRALTQGV